MWESTIHLEAPSWLKNGDRKLEDQTSSIDWDRLIAVPKKLRAMQRTSARDKLYLTGCTSSSINPVQSRETYQTCSGLLVPDRVPKRRAIWKCRLDHDRKFNGIAHSQVHSGLQLALTSRPEKIARDIVLAEVTSLTTSSYLCQGFL